MTQTIWFTLSRPVQRDIPLNRDMSYTLSRINVGRRVSPQSFIFEEKLPSFYTNKPNIFHWDRLSFFLHFCIRLSARIGLCGYPNTNTHIDLEERGCKYLA